MATVLKKRFPMIRDREEVLSEIQSKEKLWAVYVSWTEEQQEDFLDIRLYFLKKVQKNFINFQMFIFIISDNSQIQELKLIYYRNMCSFPLTSFGKNCTIKV